MPCNWKTLIDGFSETYHVQGLHREMLPMTDDVNSPQRLWDRHGKLEQPYGVASPRLRDGATDQEIYDAFVEVMGTRIGKPTTEPAGPVPEIPTGGTLRDVLADGIRRTAAIGRRRPVAPHDRPAHEHAAVQPVPERDDRRVPRSAAGGEVAARPDAGRVHHGHARLRTAPARRAARTRRCA